MLTLMNRSQLSCLSRVSLSGGRQAGSADDDELETLSGWGLGLHAPRAGSGM
jgi:hypothetical protein